MPLFQHPGYNFIFRERTVFFQNRTNDIGDNTLSVTPLGQRIESASDQNETFVFDEFIVASGRMGFFAK